MEDILEYENLVRSVINRYSYYGDYEDLYQAGMMGLAKALKNYKAGDAKFSSYAYDYIIGEVTFKESEIAERCIFYVRFIYIGELLPVESFKQCPKQLQPSIIKRLAFSSCYRTCR